MERVTKYCKENRLTFILSVIGAVVVIAGIAAIVCKVLQNRQMDDSWDFDDDDDDCCFYADADDHDEE
jgi:hypothetical protein